MNLMIIVTGAAGFIGSQIALHLDQRGIPLIVVDKKQALGENTYLENLKAQTRAIEAEQLESQLAQLHDVQWVIHMGAITNTAETNLAELKKWNVDYTKMLWDFCVKKGVNFIYASSAATYGSGTQGFSDDHNVVPKLKPLNPYGQSKQDFDMIALNQRETPKHWYGLKYFNVYGPHEDHKGRMASAVWHGYNEIRKTGAMTLFRSHNPGVKDGDQARDFIFVGDVLHIIDFLMAKKPENGIYNCGSGRAGTFMELAQALFSALGKPLKINWVETPEQFRKAYQYCTEADMRKLSRTGYSRGMTSLANGIQIYLEYLNAR